MNIYKAIWHFGRQCFLLGAVTSFPINCSLCCFPSVSEFNLFSRLNNLTFQNSARSLHIWGLPLFVRRIALHNTFNTLETRWPSCSGSILIWLIEAKDKLDITHVTPCSLSDCTVILLVRSLPFHVARAFTSNKMQREGAERQEVDCHAPLLHLLKL